MTVCIGRRVHPTAPLPDEGERPFRSGHVKTRPAPALAAHVDHYWVTRWDRRGEPPRTAAALLEPCVHLHIRDGRAELMGVVRGTYQTCIEGVGCVIGVRFRPGGFYPFVRQSVSQWTDRVLPAEEVLGVPNVAEEWGRALWDAMDECRGDAGAHAAVAAARLDTVLSPLLLARDPLAEELASLVASIAAVKGARRVRDLVRASGRSERTLHRLFLRYVGVSPAWVIRRYRLHAAAARLTASPGANVQGLAYELGYADQAHFIRDFRATIGVTPGAYVSAR